MTKISCVRALATVAIGDDLIHVTAIGDGSPQDVLIKGTAAFKILAEMPKTERAEIVPRLPEDTFLVTSLADIDRCQADAGKSTQGLPSLLYHCTHAENIPRIKKNGLLPRKLTGKDNYAKKMLSSHEDFVYLTEGNIAFYLNLLKRTKATDLAVVVVDPSLLDETKFYPDEDWLSPFLGMPSKRFWSYTDENSQAKRASDILIARNNLDSHQSHWQGSLAGYGNVSYRGIIPPDAIRQVVRHLDRFYEKDALKGDYLLLAYPVLRDELVATWETSIGKDFLGAR
jgi:hypothetical protein